MKCFYHLADLDGQSSAAIIKYVYPKCELIPFDYNRKFYWDKIKEDEEVFIVDLSLPIEDMLKLDKISILTWIDHHETAILKAKEYNFNPDGLREVGKAACELVWEYLFPDQNIPEAVYLLGRYDVFDHKDKPKALPFQYGMKIEYTDPNNQDLWSVLFRDNSIQTSNLIKDIINNGKIISSFTKQQNRTYAQSYAFETKLLDYKAIAINSGLFNSHLFDSVWDNKKYDIMICFCLKEQDGKKGWKISLYTDKDNIHVGKIAETFKGGGHHGASGFYCKELPFDIKGL